MRILRAAIRLTVLLLSTFFFYSLIMIVLLLSVFGVNYERWRGYLLRNWGKSCCLILGCEVQVKGKAPEPPFFLVSNHLSYFDVFVLFSQLRGIFVAKSDVKSWPLVGMLTRTCGILFIDRERKMDIPRVNQLISQNVNKNQGVIVFPESQTSPGVEILPFRSSLLEYPASVSLPVTYAAITYSSPEGEIDACKEICWWENLSFLTHFMRLLMKKEFTASITFGKKKVASTNRKELARELL
ncbi:MAG: 1-acyl-sn-glycerol-3-phosphate acyltransferase, partial [Balneolaceae bacterium]